jgi:chemotaxis protein MotB
MSGRRHRKKAHEEENAERWLLTYADMITLLVAFFMMMYSMSIINLEKFRKAAIGIRSGFNGVSLQDKSGGESIIEKGTRNDIAPAPPALLVARPDLKAEAAAERNRMAAAVHTKLVEARNRRIHELTDKFNEKMAVATNHGKLAKIVATNKGVAIEMVGDLIFFPKGTAQLSDEAKKVLRAIVDVLTSVPNEISVEGHTSAGKTAGTTFLDNWELSTSRATAVVKFLLTAGTIDPKRISVTGYGEYRPLVKEEPGAVGIEHNDRVRVFIFQD